MISLDTQLSDHFFLWEFVTSQNAERLGIDNTPTEQAVKNLTRLCTKILEPARVALGPIIISSGFRSPFLNRAVGGSETSSHLEGWCADCNPTKVSRLEFAKWVSKHCLFDQIILEFGTKDRPAWIHVSADPRSRGQIKQVYSGQAIHDIKI